MKMEYPIVDQYFKPHPAGHRCGCEMGYNCSKISVCSLEAAIDETKEEFKDLLYAIEEICHDNYDGAPDAGPEAHVAGQILAVLQYGPKGHP